MKQTLCLLAFLTAFLPLSAQNLALYQDTSLNNLVLPAGTKTCRLGQLGSVKVFGRGKTPMVIICGWGFGYKAFKNFVDDNRKQYKMYVVTPAGFAGTAPPPMPEEGYEKQSWTNAVEEGVLKLIADKKLKKPVIVGHFVTGTQVALNLALHHPDKIGKVVILGGEAYRYYRPLADTTWGREQNMSVQQRQTLVSRYWAPRWFKTVTRQTWNSGNYHPDDYAVDSLAGQKLFDMSAEVPMPVMIRYLLEFFDYDISDKYEQIKTPVLVLMPSFSPEFLAKPFTFMEKTNTHDFLKYYYQNTWDSARSKNPLFRFETIPDSRIFIWYDNPEAVYTAISNFIHN